VEERADKQVIGRAELVDLPELHLSAIPARVDTGALTCSIHCHDIEVVGAPDGSEHIRFTLLDPAHPDFTGMRLEAAEFSRKVIRSSMGEEQERFAIRTVVVLGGRRLRTEFTLADRENMSYSVLLGRRVLRGRFLVDVSIAGDASPAEDDDPGD
jgi:hypothetical protein